jgi:hypothetical protein
VWPLRWSVFFWLLPSRFPACGPRWSGRSNQSLIHHLFCGNCSWKMLLSLTKQDFWPVLRLGRSNFRTRPCGLRQRKFAPSGTLPSPRRVAPEIPLMFAPRTFFNESTVILKTAFMVELDIRDCSEKTFNLLKQKSNHVNFWLT